MTVTTIINFIHLLAAVTWIGAGIFINIILNPSLRALEPMQAGKLMGSVSKRMIRISWMSALLLVVTGFMKIPHTMLFNFNSVYASVITLKLCLVLIVLIFASLITFVYAPKIIKFSPQAGENPSEDFINSQKKLKVISALSTITGVIIILLVSIL